MYNSSSPESIQALFASIATHYDRANALLSLGMHTRWNRALVEALTRVAPASLLDLCAGTGEIGLAFLKKNPQGKATLLDFCPEMLEVAKIKGGALKNRFEVTVGDAQRLNFAPASFEAVSIAYGVRNLKQRHLCFQETFRVLKPGGTFAILELTRPQSLFLRLGHKLYLRFFLPFLGKLCAKNHKAYAYLARSISQFTPAEQLTQEVQAQGFTPIHQKVFFNGVATLFLFEKKCAL